MKKKLLVFIVALTLVLSTANVLTGGTVSAKPKDKVNPKDYTGQEIETMFGEVERFITLTENETVGVLDSKTAKKAGTSKEAINLANYYVSVKLVPPSKGPVFMK